MSGGFFTFHKSVIGYRHINEKIPCQDSSVSYTVDDGSLQIIAVGDGHGDPARGRAVRKQPQRHGPPSGRQPRHAVPLLKTL